MKNSKKIFVLLTVFLFSLTKISADSSKNSSSAQKSADSSPSTSATQSTSSAKSTSAAQSTKPAQSTQGEFYTIPEPKRLSVGISGLNKSQTVKFRNSYLTESKQVWLSQVLYDSIPYRPYIRQQLKKRKMPLCLQFLPIVESNYKVTATSPSGAKGLWQFMENSMSPYMKKNWWYDERLDPWKETDAALLKLAENYKTFGDWAFALAAYNMGAGALKRLIKQYPGKDFWWLAENGKLRSETADYVPKLLAISDIVMNAEYWGALRVAAADKRIENVSVTTYDYIKITGSISFTDFSKATGISSEKLKFLNPALLRECTPPKSTWRLRLPKGSAKKAAADLKAFLQK